MTFNFITVLFCFFSFFVIRGSFHETTPSQIPSPDTENIIPASNLQPETPSCCSGVKIQKCPDGTTIEAYCCDEQTCQWQYMDSCPQIPQIPEPSPSESEPSPAPSSESEPSPVPSSESGPSPAPSSNVEPVPQPSSLEMAPQPIPNSEEPCENMEPSSEPTTPTVTAPVASPISSPVWSPVASPVASQQPSSEMSEPCENMEPSSEPNAPVSSPVSSPASSPASSPTSSPASSPVSSPVSSQQPSPASTPIVNVCAGRCSGTPSCPQAQCRMVSVTKPGVPSPASNCGSSSETITASGTVTDSPSGIDADGTVTISKDIDINGLGSIVNTPSGISITGTVDLNGPVSATGTITDTPSGIVATGTITDQESSSPCNSTGSSNSTIVVDQCEWVCPSFCSSWCSSYECPSGTSLVSCGSHTDDLSSCLPICASSECSDLYTSENVSSECSSGRVELWQYSNGNCTKSCPWISCDDPCSPNCVPICSIGGSQPPCLNSRCQLNAGVEILPGGASATPAILSSCSWTPTLNSYNCVSEVTNQCNGNPMCAAATCETDSFGNNYWDNTVCNLDCTSLNGSQCPGGFLNCSGGPGICTLIGNSCSWICPINPCQNSTGSPLCTSPAPVGTPFDGCLSWNSRCIVSNVTAFPAVCTWDVQCTAVNQSLSGPCNITECGLKPNTGCSGSETWSCTRPSGVGICQWLYTCPPNLNLSIPCSDDECNSLYLVNTRNTSVCGINPTAKPVCIRNCMGVCQDVTPCYPVYQPPACLRSPCGDACYDPRWLSGEQIAPDSFNASKVDIPSANCSTCLKRCSGFLLCGRPSNNPICQFSHSDAYDKCVSRCTTQPILSPIPPVNQTTQCSGRNPCQCNYTLCTFVTVQYSSGNLYAECLSNDNANHASSLPGYMVLYSSVSLPSYCPLINSTNSSTPVGKFINRVNNCSSDTLQQNLIDKLLNMTNSTSNYTDYIPQISAVLVPSVNTSSNSSLFNSSLPTNSSSNSTLVNVGVVVSLLGDQPPSNITLAQWCQFILHDCIAPTMQISTSQLGLCSLFAVGSSSGNPSFSSKRGVQNPGFYETYLLTTVVDVSGQNVVANPLASPPNQSIAISAPTSPHSPSSANGLMCSVVVMVALVLSLAF